MSRSFDQLDYRVEGGTATITLRRPEAKNAFTTALYAQLRDAVRLSDRDPNVRCIVITGSGGAFAAGGDLKEMLGYLDAQAKGPDLNVYRFEDSLPFTTIRNASRPVIAAVNGICVGGGLTTVAVCDIVVAAASARFGIPEARVGLVDAYLPTLLFGQVSLPKLKYLAYTGKVIGAAEAERIGLVTEVVPDEKLEARVAEIVAELAATSDSAKAQFKAMFNRLIPEISMRDVWPLMFTSEVRERLLDFAQRVKPASTGRSGP